MKNPDRLNLEENDIQKKNIIKRVGIRQRRYKEKEGDRLWEERLLILEKYKLTRYGMKGESRADKEMKMQKWWQWHLTTEKSSRRGHYKEDKAS